MACQYTYPAKYDLPAQRICNTWLLSYWLMLMMPLFFVLPMPVQAQEEAVVNFNISPGPIDRVLTHFARQAGVAIAMDTDKIVGVDSPGIKGTYPVETGLGLLLQGSGLVMKKNASGYVLVSGASVKGTEQDAVRLPEMTVTGTPDPDSPYSTQYKVPDTTTANKTRTPIMETPMSIQVVPKSVMNDQQAITLEQALSNVSGVFPQGNGNLTEAYNIRGFYTYDYYRDGMRFQTWRTQTGPREVANLERIEVLKGPASILYGRMEPGGMVNLVPKKPQVTPYYSLQQQFGSYNLFRTTLDATGGLNQESSLLYRLNFAYEDKGSFRQFVDNHHFFVAPVLQWQISDRTQITAEMEYKTGKWSRDYGIPAVGNRPANLPIKQNLTEPFSGGNFNEILAGFNWSHAFNESWEVKHRFYVSHADQDSSGVLLSGVRADNRTVDRFYSSYNPNKNDVYNTSLDLTGHIDTWGIKHTLVMGGDYFNQRNKINEFYNYSFPSIDILNPVHSGSPISDPAANGFVNLKEEWFGFYLQDQVKLPYNIHLLAGLRYDNVIAESNSTNAQGITTFTEIKQDKVSPRVGLLWQPIKPISFYGNYVENLGPNAYGTAISGQPLKAETGKQWEAGVKTELLDGRFSATLAWFHLTKNNMATPHPNPVLAARGIAVQTGEARSKGIELDIIGELLPGWQVIANYAYTDTEITLAYDGTQGNRLPNIPRHAGNIWSTYAFQNETLRGLKVGGGVTLRSKREGDLQNDFQMPGYAVFNLMTSYAMKIGKTRVTAQLNVNNLFNEEYFPSSGLTRTRITVGTPRVFLGSLRIEY